LAKEIDLAQKQLHLQHLKNHLQNLKMSEKEYESFTKYRNNVKREVLELRAILEAVDAKSKERVWLRNHTSGDIDETRLLLNLM
jgi:von Willebrand factor A domain-containing protein 8